MSNFKVNDTVLVGKTYCKVIEIDIKNDDYLCWPINSSEWVEGQTEFKGVGSWVNGKNIVEVQS